MKILTKIVCGVAMLSTMALIGCGSPEDVLNDPSGGGHPEQPGSPEEKAAREAFAQTFVAGDNSWAMTGVRLEYLKKDLSTNKVKAHWDTNCDSSGLRLVGDYPNVTLVMGQTRCEPQFHPFELAQLELILRQLVYGASHEHNQFRLELQNNDMPNFHFATQEAKNSFVRRNGANFNFAAIEVDDVNGARQKSTYLVDVAVTTNGSGEPTSLKISFNEESSVRQDNVEIQIFAQLLRNH